MAGCGGHRQSAKEEFLREDEQGFRARRAHRVAGASALLTQWSRRLPSLVLFASGANRGMCVGVDSVLAMEGGCPWEWTG